MIKVGDIQVTVTYKRVKRVTLKVTNGEVVLVCPRDVKEEYIVGFVEKNAEWIRRKLYKKSFRTWRNSFAWPYIGKL